MKAITLQEIHQLQLHMLDCIHEYCIANNLRYSLGGGTLLGAIRHKGSIPWDDDVDIMMPRPDYERFLKGFYGKYEHCVLWDYTHDKHYPNLFAKVYDDRTILKESGLTYGVYIDVFPIDGLPAEENAKAYFEEKSRLSWKLCVLGRSWWGMPWKCKLWWFVTPPLNTVMQRCNRFLRAYDFETAECTGCAVGKYGIKELMGKETFKHYINVEFEGRSYSAIADYDAYLVKHYGDYMQLPPENKRRTHHRYECWWKECI